MDLTLRKPDVLGDDAWRAIELHRGRLVTAIGVNDAPWIIGSAKELVECVARVAAEVKGVVTASNADFSTVVNDAHAALERQAGKGITAASDIRAIAQHAKKIVLSVKDVRNDFGTGHGRAEAEVKSITDEMVSLVVAGSLLWVRWALTRVEHLLIGAPENLIAELRNQHLSRRSLAERLDALVLPEQPDDVQRALGVAFAQRSVNGTFVARQVGLDGPANSGDLTAWPTPYRLGAAEGLTFSHSGFLALGQNWVPVLVDIVLPLPPGQLKQFIADLGVKVEAAAALPNTSAKNLHEVASAIRAQTERLPESADKDWRALADLIDPTTID